MWITSIFLTFKYSIVYTNQVSDTCNFILTVPSIVSFWDPKMRYKCWYIGSVLQKAWWWLNRLETCCLECNYIIKCLCLTVICILYEHYFPFYWRACDILLLLQVCFRKNVTLTEERTLCLLQADYKLHDNLFLQADSWHDNWNCLLKYIISCSKCAPLTLWLAECTISESGTFIVLWNPCELKWMSLV